MRVEQSDTSVREIGDLKAALEGHAVLDFSDSQEKITFVHDEFCVISKHPREELPL
jgi:hypothetical protein